jgi:hypothetical protein
MIDVTNFGAAGDGKTDDTESLQHAIDMGGGVIDFPPGKFLITSPLHIDLSKNGPVGVRGAAGTSTIIMKGAGPAFRITGSHEGTAAPQSWTEKTKFQERFPTLMDLEIRGEHPDAVGVEFVKTAKPTVRNVLIRYCRVGIHLRERNRDVLIADSHIYDNADYGIFLDEVNLHQMIVCGCHISYNKAAAIAMIGGDLHNLQFTGNDIEYSHSTDFLRPGSAEFHIDARNGVASEITIASNTIQARASKDGANIRILGHVGPDGFPSVRLIAITGNVIGSQEASIVMDKSQRVTITGNTIYDGHTIGVRATDCDGLVIASNVHGWSHAADKPRPDHYEFVRCVAVAVTGEVFQTVGGETAVVALRECRDVALGNLIIRDARARGIYLEKSEGVTVTGCVIGGKPGQPLLAAIEATPDCKGLAIVGNVVSGGAIKCDPGSGQIGNNVTR